MDPFSMSILGIISAASFVVNTIRKLDEAPPELLQIADIIRALETSLEDVHRCCSNKQMLTEGLAFHLQCSEQRLLELTAYLKENKGLTTPGKPRSPVNRLRYRDKLKAYQLQLSNTRDDLFLSLSAFRYGQTGRISMVLQQCVPLEATASRNFDKQALKFGDPINKTEDMRLARDEVAKMLEAIRVGSSESCSALESPQASSIVQLHHSIEMGAKVKLWDGQGSPGPILLPRQDRQSNTSCSGACRCACHKQRRLATPISAKDWIGGLSVTFSGVAPLNLACTSASCAHNLSPSASVDFRLPSWLASKMICVWLKAAPMQGPELLLRSRRIIETSAYYTAEQGNLVALRQLHIEGRAGIHDVNPLSGRNTLFDSIFRGHLHIVRYLLGSGADMEAADFCGFTPRDLAFQRVHTTCPTNVAEQLHLLFRLDEVPDDMEFTTAHRIVLGLSNLDLEEHLSEHPEEVNEIDLLGRTPLWWAVRRDDETKSLLLLRHNADPSIANAAGRSPLHNAAAQGNLTSVEALLSHNADIHQRSFEGKTALQVVGVYGVRDDVLIVKRLLDAGSDINARDGYGRTPISLCCFDSHLNIAHLLLQQGADITIPDVNGWKPWHWAIYDGAARIVSLYLNHHCDLSAVIDGGTTILHFVAKHCAVEELADALLLKADLSNVDPLVTNAAGKTAEETLEERHAADMPVCPLGESLYTKIRHLIALAGANKAALDSSPSPASTME